MKNYIKPEIKIEDLELEDVILASGTTDGNILNPFDLTNNETK